MENKIHQIPLHEEISVVTAVSGCLFLSILYVSSLYIWRHEENRNHPSMVKKRFCSVFIVMLISPIVLYMFSSKNYLQKTTIFEAMGLRKEGLIPAMFISALLTLILFFGPLCVQGYNGAWKTYVDPKYWIKNLQNLVWLRNHIVAPLSEEFTFRACMMPLLFQCFSLTNTIIITPLFFGVGHFHHMFERLRSGMDYKTATFITCFQFCYTTIFGIYAAYLFAKTRHFVAPFVAHTLCNHMGFPDLQEVFIQEKRKRNIFLGLYVLGLLSWLVFTPILTDPFLFKNNFILN